MRPKSSNIHDKRSKTDYSELIQKFEEEMVMLNKNTKEYSKLMSQLKQQLKKDEETIKKEQEALIND